MSTLEHLIASRPSFHGWPDGRAADWSMPPEVLRHLDACLTPEMTTLETGAGASTIVFAINRVQHTCVTPDRSEIERIEAYCAREKIEHRITFIADVSDRALPSDPQIPAVLDLVLIDGAHRFPIPMLDWHFTEQRLQPGGIVVLDDIQLPSVRLLYDFLVMEDEWAPPTTIGTTAFFRRLRPTLLVNDWQGQKINQQQAPAAARKRSLRDMFRRDGG